MKLDLIATAAFGLEAVVRREIEALGYKVEKTEDGKVTFMGDERAIVRANLWLRTADRVLIRMGEFMAPESEDLFQTVKGMPWENLIPPDGKFTVNASTVKSRLRSEPNCQKTVKKAIVERLSSVYGIDQFPETGALYDVKVSLLKDRATITVDTSGEALHKRGYRTSAVAAPIKETLAAALIQLSFWNPDRVLADPCCGSGTFPIEAALIGRNIAPGLSRSFVSEEWGWIDPAIWKEERRAAFAAIQVDRPLKIYASDIDPKALAAAEANAEEAGVDDAIVFKRCDISAFVSEDFGSEEGMPASGVILTNPPYGKRIGDREAVDHIDRVLSDLLKKRRDWSLFLISPDKSTEKKIRGRGGSADRRRKLYNGQIEVCYYQFHGEKPKKKQ